MHYAYNEDLENIYSPVRVEILVKLLRELKYDSQEIAYLEKGFTEGFDIGYRGPQNRTSRANNLPFKVGNPTELWNKLIKRYHTRGWQVPLMTSRLTLISSHPWDLYRRVKIRQG